MENTATSLTDFAAIAKSLNLPEAGVQATVDLLDEGNTVPFITRYRKDRTGGLDEEQIRQIHDAVTLQRQLSERKQKILKSIQSQEKLTDQLKEQVLAATTNKVLEDLYLPFKPRKQSLANVARQRGLEPVARAVLSAAPEANDLESYFTNFIKDELPTVRDVEIGVQHLLAEHFGEQVELRDLARRIMWEGRLQSTKIETPPEVAEQPEPAKPVASKEGETASSNGTSGIADAPADAPKTTDATKPADSATDNLEEKPAETAESPVAAADAPTTPPAESPATETTPVTESAVTETTSPTDGDEKASGGKPSNEKETVGNQDQDQAQEPANDADSTSETEITMAQTVSTAVTTAMDTVTSAADGAKSKKAGKTVAQTKAELARQRREMRREARHRKRQKLEQSFKDYFDFGEQLKKLPHHRILALNRGDRSKVLRVRIEFDADRLRSEAENKFVNDSHPHATFISQCLNDALSRLVAPSIDREIRRDLTDKAEKHAVSVFAQNLRKLLLQAPLSGRRVLAIDPGFKSGCKLVALDEFGNVLDHCLVHVIGSASRVEESRARLAEEVRKHDIGVIAIGNGTASRETEQMVAQTISESLADLEIGYLVVNEAGASVYSTSPIGREELPKHDATVRGAVSIGRRTLDPLSELVKIDPANIGVGLYQHDVKAKHLQDSLDAVVESCVNYVGVDVNSASPALLGYVSGLNQLTARRVYEHRLENGPFKNREDLKNVPGVGEATYVQAAGFLKISEGDNPLDRTWIHPESYEVAEKVLEAIGCELNELSVPTSVEPTTCENPEPKQSETVTPEEETLETVTPVAVSPETATSESVTPETVTPETENSEEAKASEQPESDSTTSTSDESTATDSTAEQPIGDESPIDQSNAATESTATTDVTKDEPTSISGQVETSSTNTSETQSTTEQQDAAATTAEPPKVSTRLAERLKTADVAQLSEQLGVGTLLLKDILRSLARPGRDPREDLAAPVFRRGVMKLENLSKDMELTGTVLNVVDFGAFVDIGLSDSGLVHVSRLSDKFVNDPHDVVSVGDILNVWVVDVDMKRRRVSLTAIKPGTEKERPGRKSQPAEGSPRSERPGGTRTSTSRARGQGKGQKRRDQRGGKGKRQQSNWKPKAKPKPVVPITDAMADGKEPMRTFSDLLQFHERKKTDGNKGK